MMANLWNLHFFYKIENVQLKISVTLEEVYITLRPCSYSKESLSTSQGVKFQWNSCSFADYKTITGQKCPLTFEQTLNVKFYHQRLSNTLFVLFPFPNFDWTIKLLKCSSAHPVMFWEGGTGDTSSTGTRVGNQRNYLGISLQRNYLGNIWQVFHHKGHMEPIWPSGRVVNIIDQNK